MKEWLDKNQPLAREKLVVKSGVSLSVIDRILKTKKPPRWTNVGALAEAMGIDPRSLIVTESTKGKRSA